MWDERYDSDEYAYGTKPNEFLETNYTRLPKGRVLSIGEGEGRNAVFLARQGYSVTAVDGSLVGLQKAERLARENEVALEMVHSDLAEYDLGEGKWDGIISIFVPLPSWLRQQIYKKIASALKPGGIFLVEAYTPRQIELGTGGGSSVETMQTKESLLSELPDLCFSHLIELEREVIEGSYHTGLGSVAQAIAGRRADQSSASR